MTKKKLEKIIEKEYLILFEKQKDMKPDMTPFQINGMKMGFLERIVEENDGKGIGHTIDSIKEYLLGFYRKREKETYKDSFGNRFSGEMIEILERILEQYESNR